MATKRTGRSLRKPQKVQNYSTPALEKGLDVIELLARQPEGLTKSQIARELKRTVSEIFRMLLCLENRGYIAQVAEERYSLTLKLFKLVQEHPPTERLIADALPVMHRLAHDTLQSCHLGVLDSDRVVILAQVNAPANLGFYVKLGSTVDLMESASGYVILSHLHEQQRERALAEWSHVTSRKLPRDLSVHLARIRETGYEKRASYLVKGVMNISFPVLDDRGSAIGALTVPYIQYTEPAKNLDQVMKSLSRAAGEITRAIGGKPGR
jgi:DNA-binding IclR family transcriptional regulator